MRLQVGDGSSEDFPTDSNDISLADGTGLQTKSNPATSIELSGEHTSLSEVDVEGDHKSDAIALTTDGSFVAAGQTARTKTNPGTTVNVEMSVGSAELLMSPAGSSSAFSGDQTGCSECKMRDMCENQLATC